MSKVVKESKGDSSAQRIKTVEIFCMISLKMQKCGQWSKVNKILSKAVISQIKAKNGCKSCLKEVQIKRRQTLSVHSPPQNDLFQFSAFPITNDYSYNLQRHPYECDFTYFFSYK